jgi:hypothetical protein
MDQRSHREIDPWTVADIAGLPAPVRTEAATVSADHGLRLDDDDRVQSDGTLDTAIRTASDRCFTVSRARETCVVALSAVGVGSDSRSSSRARHVNRDRIASSSRVRNVAVSDNALEQTVATTAARFSL